MTDALFSIEEARVRLGRISRNSLYALLRSGALPSVTIGCRRFVSGSAIDALIQESSTTTSPSTDRVRSHRPLQIGLVGIAGGAVVRRKRQASGAS
jgi:hypothetical protein